MFKTIISIVIAILLFQFFHIVPAFGQSRKNDTDVAKIKTELTKRGIGEKAKVKIELNDGREVKGYIDELKADDFVIADSKSNGRTTISYNDVKKVRKPGISYLAILGFAGAIGTGLLIVATANSSVKCPLCSLGRDQ
jgi:hypothetical protein